MISNGKDHQFACSRAAVVFERLQEPAYLRPKNALRQLLTAYHYAQQVNRDVWDFAVTIEGLESSGMTESDFRWLACEGIVQHAREVTRLQDSSRQFRPSNQLLFKKRTCVVLTEHGYEVARSLFDLGAVPQDFGDMIKLRAEEELRLTQEPLASAPCVPFAHPCWEADRHELRLDGALVKQFKWPAANQEIIL